MGMFDYLRCEYPLPVDGANELEYQTKDTPSQFLENYKIEKDGTLSYESCRYEDRSDQTLSGIMRLAGMMTRIVEGWEKVCFTGEIRFYTTIEEDAKWIEFSSYFVDGKLKELVQIKNKD